MPPEISPVQFEEDKETGHKRNLPYDPSGGGGFLIKMVIKSGLAKNRSGADKILYGVALLFIVLTIFVIFS